MLNTVSKAIIILLLAPMVAWAKPNGGAMHPCGAEGLHHMPRPGFTQDELPPYLADLTLSEQQKATIKQIVNAKGEAMKTKMDEAFKLKMQIHNFPFSMDYSEDKVKALIAQATQSMAQAQLEKAQIDNAVYQVLTEEQREQLKTKMADFPHPPKG